MSNDNTISTIQELSNLNNEVVDLLDSVTEIISNTETQSIDNRLFNTENFIFQTFIEAQARGDVVIPQRPAIRWSRFTELIPQDAISAPQPVDQDTNSTNIILSTNSTNTITSTPETLIIPITALNTALNKPKIIAKTPIETITNLNIRQEQSSIISNHFSSKNNTPLRFIYEFDPKNSVNPETASQRRIPKSTPVFTINADTSITINPDYRGIVYRILVYAVEQDKYNDVTNKDNPTYITDRNRHLSDPYTIEVQELPLPPIRLHQNIETKYNLDLSQSNVEIQFYNLFIKNIIDSTTDPVDLIYSCNISPPTSTNYNGSLLNIIRIDEGDDINDGLKITQDFRGKIDYTVTFIATDSLYKRSRELDISFHEIRPVDKKATPNVLSNLQDRPIIISLLDHFKANTKNDLTYTSNITDITDPIPRVNVIDATDDPYVINTSDNTLQIYPDYRNDTFNITVSAFDEKYPLQPVSYVFTWIEKDAPPPIRNPLPEYDHINLGLLLETSCNFTLPEYFISRTKTHESNLEYIIHDVYDRGGNRLYQLPPTSLVDIINTLNTPPNPTLTITPKLQNKNLIHTIYVNAIDNNYNKSVIGPEKDKSKSLTITFTESESISIINTPPSIINVDTRNPITCNLLDYFQSPVPTKLGYTIKNPPNPRLSYIDSGVPPFVLNDTNDLITFNPDFRDDEYTLSIVAFDQRTQYSQYRRQIDFNIVETPPPSPIINTALDISLKLLPTLYTCNLNDYIVSTIGSQLTFFKDGARLFENTLTLQPKLRGSTDTFKISAKDDIYGTITENDITFHVTEFYSINQNSNIISIPTTPLTDDTIQCNLYTIFSSPINTPLHFSATSPCNLRDSYRTVDTPISAFSIDNDTGILTIAADYRDTEYRVDIVASDPEYPEQTCNISFNIVETFFPTITPIKDEIVLVTALDNTEVINLDEIFVSPYHSPDYTLSNAVFPQNPVVDIKILDEKLYYKKPFVGSDEDELTFLIQGSTYRIDRDSSLSGLSGFPSIAINDDGIQYKTFHVPVTTLSTNHPTYTYTTTGSSTTYEIKSILVDISLFTEIDNRSNLVFKNTHDNNFPNRVEINCFKQGTNIKLNDRTVTTRTVRFNLDPIYVEDLKNTPIVCNILPDTDYNYEIYNDFRVISTTLPIPVEEAPVSIINKSNIQINPDYRGDTYAVILNNDNVKALFIISEEAPIRLTDSDIFPDIYASGIEKITCNVGYLYDVNVPNCNLLIDIQYNYPVQKGFNNGGKDAVEYDPQSQDIHIYPEYREFNNDDVGYQVSLRGYVEGYRDRSVLRTFHIREDDLPPISIYSLWETVIDKETFNLSNQEYIYLDINTLYTYVFPEQIEFRVITSGIPPDFLPYPDARIENNSNIIYSAKLRNTSYNITVEAFDKTRPSNKNAELTIDVSELPPIQKHSFITPDEFSRLGRNPAEIYLSNIFTDTIPLDPYRIQYTVDVVSTVNNITSKTKGIYSESFIVEETSGVLRVYPEYRDATYDIIVIAYINEFTNSTVSHTITNVRELEIPSLSNADPSNIDIVELGLNSGDILFSQFYKDYPYADKLILDPEDPYTVLSNTGNAAFDVSSKQGSFNVSGSLLANEYTFTLNVIDQIFDQSQRGDITVSVIETIPLTLVTDPSIPFDFPQALAESFFISISNYVKNNSDQKVRFNIIYDTDNTQFVDPTDTQYLSREGDPIIQKIVDQEGNETGITIIPDCRDISYRFKFEVFLYDDGGGYKTSTNVKGQLTEYITITEDTPPPIGNIYIQDNVFNVSLKSLSNTYNISNVFRVDQDPYSAYKDDLTYTVYIDHPDTNISATVDSNAQTLTVFPNLRNISYDIYLEITDTASKLSPPDNATSNLFMSVVEARPIVSNPSASTSFHSLSNNDVVVYIRDLFINNHHQNDFTFSITYNETTPSTGIHRKIPAIIENETNDTITYSSDYRGDTYTIDISAVVTGYPDFSCNITLSFEEQILPTIPSLHTGVSSNIALITTSKTFFITDFYNLSGYPYPEDIVYTIYTPYDNCNITASTTPTSSTTPTFTIFPDLRDDTYDVYLEITDPADPNNPSFTDCNIVLRITEEAPINIRQTPLKPTSFSDLSNTPIVITISDYFINNHPSYDLEFTTSYTLLFGIHTGISNVSNITDTSFTYYPDYRGETYDIKITANVSNYITQPETVNISFTEIDLPTLSSLYLGSNTPPSLKTNKITSNITDFYNLSGYPYPEDLVYTIYTPYDNCNITTSTSTPTSTPTTTFTIFPDLRDDTYDVYLEIGDRLTTSVGDCNIVLRITEEAPVIVDPKIQNITLSDHLSSCNIHLSNVFKSNDPLDDDIVFSNILVSSDNIRKSAYGDIEAFTYDSNNGIVTFNPDFRTDPYKLSLYARTPNYIDRDPAIHRIYISEEGTPVITLIKPDECNIVVDTILSNQEISFYVDQLYDYKYVNDITYDITTTTQSSTSTTITNTNKNFTEKVIDNRKVLSFIGDFSGDTFISSITAKDSSVLNNSNTQLTIKITEEEAISVFSSGIPTVDIYSNLTSTPQYFDLSNIFKNNSESNHTFSVEVVDTGIRDSYYGVQKKPVEIIDNKQLAIYPDYRNRSYTVQVTSTFSQWGYNSVVPIETANIPIDETSIDLNAISFTLFDHEESDLGILVYDQECNVVLPRNYTYEFKDHLIYSFTQSNLNDESGNTDLLTSPTITNGTLKVYGDRSGINYIITVIATDNNFQIDNKEFKIKVSNLPITTLSFDSEYRLTKVPLKFDLSEYFQSVYSSFSHTISHTNLPQSYYVEQRNAVIRDGSNLAIYPEYRGEEYTITVVATNPDNIALTQTKTINIYESNLPSISVLTPTTLITPSTTQTNIGLDTITYTLNDIFDPYPFTEHLTYTITSNYDEAFITYNQDRTQLSIQGAYRNTTHTVNISASDPNYPLSSTTSADITISISECNILHTTPPVDIYTSGDTECNIYLSNFYNDLPNTDITFTVELDGGGEGGNADTSIFSYDPTDYKITLSPYYRGTSHTLTITPYILSTLERSSNTIEIHEEIIPRITLSGSSTLLFSNLISADISVDLDTLYDTTKYPYWNDVIFKVDPTSYSINTNNTFTYTASGGSKPILATITDISIKAEDSTTVFADGSRQTDTLDISIHELPILGISSGKDCNIRVNDEIFQSATSNLPYTFYDDPLFLKYATTYSSLLDATTTVSVLSPTTPTAPTTPTITPIINLDQSNIIFDIDTRGISYRIDLSVSYKDGDGTDTSYNNNEYNIFVEEKKPIDYNSTSLSITECNVKYEGGIVVGTVVQEYDISKHFILGRSECNLVVSLVDSNLPDNTNYNDPSELYIYVENSSTITLKIGMRDISYSLDFNVYMEGYKDWGELPLRLSVSEIEDIGTISLKQNAPSQSLYFLDVLNERRVDLSQFYVYSLPANIRYKISDDSQNTKGTNEVYIEDGSNLVIKTLPKRGERYTVNIQAYDDVLKENNISNNNLTFTVTEVIELQALVDDITIYDLTINECNIDVSQYFNTYECNYAIQKYTCNGELINVNTNGAFITYTPNLQNTDYTITINSYYEEVSTSTKVENTNSSFTITFKELAPFDIDVPKTTLNKQTGWNIDHTGTIPQSVSLNNIFTINHPNSNIDDLTVSSQTTNTTGKYTDFNLYTINNTTIDFQQDYRGDDTTVIFTATLSGYPDYSSNFSVVIPECNLPEIEVKNVGVGNSVVDIGLLYDDDCNVILSNLYDNTYPFSIKYNYEIETPTPIPEPDLSQSADKENLTIQSSTTFYNTQLTDPLEYNIRITAYDEITPSHSNRDVLLSVVQLPQLLLRDGQVSEINNANDGNYDINSRYNIGNNTSYSHLIEAYFVNEPSLAGFNSNDLYAWNTERDAIVISKDYRGGNYSNVLNVRYKSHIDLVGDTNITINVSEDKPVSVDDNVILGMKQSINNAVATNPESIYRYDLDTLEFVNHVDTGTNQTLLFSVSGNIKRSKYFYGGGYSNVQIVDGINSNILEIAPEYNGKYEVILSVMTSNVVYQTPDSRVLYIPIEIVESNLPDIEVLNANVNVSYKDYDLTNNIVYPFRDYINYTISSVDSISTYDTSYGSSVDSFTINTANNINFEKTFKYPSGSFRNAQYTVNIQVDDPLATSIATFALDVVELPAITFKGNERNISINLSHLEFVKTVSITESFLKIEGTPIYTYSRNHIGIRSHDLECNVVEIEYGSTSLHVYNEYRGVTTVPISVKVEGIEHSSVSFDVIINEPYLYQYVQDIDKDLGVFYNTVIPITNPIQYLIDYPFPHDLVVDTHPNAIIADDSTGSQSINIYIEDKLVGTSTLMTVSLNWEVGNKNDIEDNAEDNSVVVWVYDKVDDDNTNDTSTQI